MLRLTLYKTDSGRPMPDTFEADLEDFPTLLDEDGNEDVQVAARLALCVEALEAFGITPSFTLE